MTNAILPQFIEIPANNASLKKRGLVFGVGINDADYIVSPTIDGVRLFCPFYVKWLSMMKRCYSDNEHLKCPSYIGCSVEKEWHLFSTFRTWMEKQDWREKELDKDILVIGNKVYGPDTCVFVSNEINTFVSSIGKLNVRYEQDRHMWLARGGVNGVQRNLGRYKSKCDALSVAMKSKYGEIIKIAADFNCRIKDGLHRHAEALLHE